MSPPHGRPKEGSLPLGGKARSAKGAHNRPPHGRPKEGSLPLGGKARSAKGADQSAPHGRPKEGSLPLRPKARSAKGAHHTNHYDHPALTTTSGKQWHTKQATTNGAKKCAANQTRDFTWA